MNPACQKLFLTLKNKKRLAITFGDITTHKKTGPGPVSEKNTLSTAS
ncbi:hypothetical protein HMPREF0201_04756 [Cedecea davisae DSM 4568]|uniref:Uncharacterized protein n=1 Tax=Cedecea davisae DSM 4568 TaxID=566551 RepID=S3IJU5_9ENTR|nr:hypothetical protein HMPREF0201_04756 [Cedecea davisae DSM 4568]